MATIELPDQTPEIFVYPADEREVKYAPDYFCCLEFPARHIHIRLDKKTVALIKKRNLGTLLNTMLEESNQFAAENWSRIVKLLTEERAKKQETRDD